MVVFMVPSSPACPPQAMLTDVIDAISASCVPSAMASGDSPMSQFRSIEVIRHLTPAMTVTSPVLPGGTARFANQRLQIESRRADEADQGLRDRPRSHSRSSDTLL